MFDLTGYGTLIEILRGRALNQAGQVVYTFLSDGENEDGSITYQELDHRARAIATLLQNSLAQPGERVLLLYPPGLEYVNAFWGCLYAGMVAVPSYPPRLNRPDPRLQTIAQDAQARVALTTPQILSSIEQRLANTPDLASIRWLTTTGLDLEQAEQWKVPETASNTLAFLQYTSGSTAQPKGVMVSHGNLVHNLQQIHQFFGMNPRSRGVIWLPPYHDMGLIGGLLETLYAGFSTVLMPPTAFLQKPVRWLQAISRYRGTVSGGPNFAYDFCAQKITDEQKKDLDLSSWEVAFTGAEPVRRETLERFVAAFEPYGFRREALYPCYGLAEATLIVSGGTKGKWPVIHTFAGDALAQSRVALADVDDKNPRELVSCGAASPDQELLIVDPQTLRRCPDERVGEIWLAGPSVAQGYWNRPEETAQTFQAQVADGSEGPFMRTGDIGFLHDGEVYLAGRAKDLIIIRGRNHYPQDIELTVETSYPGLLTSSSAVFSVDVEGEERLVIVQELDRHARLEDAPAMIAAIRQAIVEQHELQAYAVVLIRVGTIPRTSSFKIQRRACRSQFLEGGLTVVASDTLDLQAASPEPQQAQAGLIGKALVAVQDPAARQALMTVYLQDQIARSLHVAPSQIDPQKPLSSFGLDSMMAVELKYAIETEFHLSAPIEEFLQGVSLGELAAQVANSQPEQSVSILQAGISSNAENNIPDAPLSHGQRALWFIHQLAPNSSAYHIASAVRIPTVLDTPALGRALRTLAERHPALRTTFPAQKDEPIQHVLDQIELSLQAKDISDWSDTQLADFLVQEAQRPFNLETGPPLRVSLLSRSAQDHILLLVIHHITADFWSLAIFADELGRLYGAECTGQSTVLEVLPIRYADYVRWQTDILTAAEGARLLAYWRQKLAGELPPLALPADRPRPPVQTYRGGSRSLRLGGEISRKIKELSQQQGATLYMTLLAAFQVFLHRYTGQTDILVGSPTAGRSRAELSRIIGYFVNPVVLRADFSGNPSFVGFLEQVRQTALEAFAHQDYPFGLLVEHLQPKRDPSRSPIFQVMFVLQKTPLLDKPELASFALGESGARLDLHGLPIESMALEQLSAQFDLTLAAAETANGLGLSLQYNRDLFDEATIQRMLAQFHALLEGIVVRPDQQVNSLPLLTLAERQLIVDWNNRALDYPNQACIHELFEAQVERTPQAIAVVFETQQMTYAELNTRANRLAHTLRSLGIIPGALVGLCVERSMDMLVGLLGILKAGGAYIPLDPMYPKERLTSMLGNSQAGVLVTQAHLAEELPESAAQKIYLDRDWPTIAAQPGTNLAEHFSNNHLAYLIYTSGSTGAPKGVQVRHRSVVNFLHTMRQEPGLGEKDILLSVTTLAFDIAALELFLPLTVGARLVLANRAVTLDGTLLSVLMAGSGTTVMQATPATWRLLLEAGWKGDPQLKVLCGGEALPRDLANSLLERCGELWNMYGPTETTIWSATCRVEAGDGPISIGHPIGNTQLYILDASGGLAPIGIPGELVIGGDGLAQSYFGNPELTAEKFIPDPFSTMDGGRACPACASTAGTGELVEGLTVENHRLYKTGDLARFRLDEKGRLFIEFLGRLDQQVKVRGFRIELDEIEAAINQHPGVREAVVLAREDQSGDPLTGAGPLAGAGKRLIAYVVSNPDTELSMSELRSALKTCLPEYMLPSAFVFLDQLPLTPNGKVDRKALPAPSGERPELAHEYVAPRTPTEETIANIWAKLLGLERVGIHDNFFESGGHSLLATQVVSRIRQAFNVELPLRTLFETPTVAELAQSINTAQHLDAPPLLPVARPEKLPLSFAQQRLWFINQLEPDNTAYNMLNAMRLHGALDVGALEHGFKQIVQRHESLRTVFRTVDGEPQQVIVPDMPVGLLLTDLSSLSPAEQETEARRLAREETQWSFDLASGPLVHCVLLRLADDPATGTGPATGAGEYILLLTLHHIISDAWSMGVLFREVILLSQAHAARQNDPLPALSLQYADFAIWQREWLQGEVLEKQLNYWKKQLADAPAALELPIDHPRPAVQTYRGAWLPVALSRELSDRLQALSRQEDATLFMTLLAAFQGLLARYSGQTDIVVGSPVANRNRAETEGLIGFFVNTLALRADLSGNPSFREALKRVREACLGAYDHQDIPFEKLVDELHVTRDLSRNPLFQAMFILQNVPFDSFDLPGLHIEPLEVQSEVAQFDLRMSLQETPAGLTGFFEYNTDLFEQETIILLLDFYRQILQGWVQNPKQRLAEIQLPQALADRVAAARARERKQTIAIAATFTAEPLEETLTFWGKELGLPIRVEFSPYNQVFQQLLDPASLFARNDYGINVILLRFEDWLRDAQPADPAELLHRNLTDLENALLDAAQRSPVPFLILLCPPSPDRADLHPEMEQHLSRAIAASGNLLLVSPAELTSYYPVDNYYDPHTDELGHMPFTPTMYAAIGSMIARKLHAIRSLTHKVIVLDCDNTLWQGVVGEDGAASVKIDPPYQALQKFMLAQLNAGMLLCVCSKNEEADVLAVFETRPEMQLKREHLVSWRINWQSKSENIQSLAAELGLGLDSFIFVDDNPLECAEVQANCPTALTLQLPQDAETIPRFLEHIWAFDHLRLTGEDKQRTELYKQNVARERLRAETLTFRDFLTGLGLKVDITEMTPSQLARVAQLTERTNQFNFTTIRRTESELQTLCQSGNQTCLVVQVSDRFGDYGLVGVLLFGQSQTAIVVDTFLMSCRVLGRGVEHHMLARLGELAQAAGLGYVEIPYVPTAKNRPALEFLQTGEQFREARGEGFLFSFPAEWAAAAVERFYSAEPARAGEGPVSAPAAAGLAAKSEQQNRIARELSNPQDILKAAQSQERQRLKQKSAYEAPRTPAEQVLVDIWKEILRIKQVGVHDDFFELGGDSLLSVRLAALSSKKALHLTPRQIFQHPTLADLAAVANTTPEHQAEQGPVIGPLPITHTQRRFLDDTSNPNHWNVAVLFETPADMRPDWIKLVVQALLEHHDELRSRFTLDGTEWQACLAPPDNSSPFSYLDFSHLPAIKHKTAIEKIAQRLQTSLNLAAGPLLRVALIHLGDNRPGRLLIIAHHTVMDGYTMRFFIEDFQSAYQQLSRGEQLSLPAKTASYKQVAEWWAAKVQSEEMRREEAYWLSFPWQHTPFPVDFPNARGNTDASATHGVLTSLSTQETRALLQSIPKQHNVQIMDVLLWALTQTLTRWTGGDWAQVKVVDSGQTWIREMSNLDLSHTVGLFASDALVMLKRPESENPAQGLQSIQKQLQCIPRRGLGYPLLLLNCADPQRLRQLRSVYKGEFKLNYLGSESFSAQTQRFFRFAHESVGPFHNPRDARDVLVHCEGFVLQERLHLHWIYSENFHQRATIAKVAQDFARALRDLIQTLSETPEQLS